MKFKRAAAMALTGAMAVSMAACGSTSSSSTSTSGSGDVDTYGTDKTAQIGVLVSDATSSEALAFRSYYEDYLAKQYDVQFIYSDELADAAGETTALENFISQGVQGVISLSSFDRPAQIETCEDAGIYYAVAAGTLTDDQYDEYKSYDHYVGSVGPSLDTEYQTGYDMAKNFIDKGDTSFLIFGGAAAYGTDMHIYRVAGMISAMCEADSSTNYDGATDEAGIVAALNGTSLDTSKFSSDKFTVDYIDGYNMDDAWFGEINEKMNKQGLQAVLAVGNGADFFGTMIPEGSGIEVGSVDSFTEDYGKAFDAGQLSWMAGKFNASIAPVFVAEINAINGAPLRTEDGDAFNLDQGYWEAADADTYHTYLDAVSDTDNPVYNKDVLDNYISTPDKTVTYDDFSTWVGQYQFDEITK